MIVGVEEMPLETKALGHCGVAGAVPLSFRRSLSSFPTRLSFHTAVPSQTRRFQSLAVVKRSPKRLKYSAPRLTKMDCSMFKLINLARIPGSWIQLLNFLKEELLESFPQTLCMQ
ncbi:hypothetical protein AABB24_025455 [Solanum stoloniferum]|uniref:Uncharacterized protein n=1 Tax=Solanum stoloniferum TaxID=62892 RepID=A0ABD2ST92_9SOLN